VVIEPRDQMMAFVSGEIVGKPSTTGGCFEAPGVIQNGIEAIVVNSCQVGRGFSRA